MAETLRVDELQTLDAAPSNIITVYIAAKLIHAQYLVDIKKNWPRLHFTARWPITTQHESEKNKLPKMWTNDNETDMLAAQVVVGFSKPEESTPLKDSLWELAMAHAHRKPLYLAGPLERFGSYAFCSSVVAKFETLDATLERVSKLAEYRGQSHADRINDRLYRLESSVDRVLADTAKLLEAKKDA